MNPDNDEYRLILLVLARVFIEIRVEPNEKKARILADIFHNAPTNIANRKPSDKILDKIYVTAKRHKCEDVIKSYFKQESQFDKIKGT